MEAQRGMVCGEGMGRAMSVLADLWCVFGWIPSSSILSVAYTHPGRRKALLIEEDCMAASKKDTVLDLNKYVDKAVRVKFQGGREVTGILKGFDQLVNLVLDESQEALRDPADPYRLTEETRDLGLVICRGTQVSLISPVDGTEEIANPFLGAEEG